MPLTGKQRLSLTRTGMVRYELKTPYRDGTTHVIFEPLDFISKLAALVPKPRVNLTRFHGVFAPNSRLRKQVTPKARCKRSAKSETRSLAQQYAAMTWAQRLKRVFNISFHVSHETIYRSLYIQARGALKKVLLGHLRRTPVMRRSRHHTQKTDDHGRINNAVPISERPASVADRAIPGHWDGDLISGSNNSHVATLVERQTRYVMLVKVNGKDTKTVVNALIKHAHKLPGELYKSLTWDRGKEMADHCRFTLATDIAVYFCDPQNPWQRGSNGNTNGLLRQYFPKGTDLSVHSQAKPNKVARQLNERPRKTLEFGTPAERFNQCVAATS